MIQLKRLKLALSCTALLTTRSYVAVAQEGALPPVYLGDTSFLDGIAGPGLLVEEIGQGVHDTRMEGPSGETNIPGGLTTAVSLTHVAYLADRKVFGAWYGAEVIATAAYLHPGDTATASGFGDLTIGPAILQWPTKKLFGRELDQRFVFDMDLPTGSYSATASANVGANAWTVHPTMPLPTFHGGAWSPVGACTISGTV